MPFLDVWRLVCSKLSRGLCKLQGSRVGLLDGCGDFLHATGDWNSVRYEFTPSGVCINSRNLQVLFSLEGSFDGI